MQPGMKVQQRPMGPGQFQSGQPGMGAQGMPGPAEDPNQAGVGLYFLTKEKERGVVYVKDIIAGRSADREGTVQVGDVIQSVDGQSVANMSMDQLRAMVVGEVGTFVSMAFERPDEDDEVSSYEVSLMRGNAEYFAQLKAKNTMQEEVERLRRHLGLSEEELEKLRKALRMAEGQGGRDKEALDRLRGLLRSAEEQLRTVQLTLNQEMMERRTMETRIASIQAQTDQEQIDLDRLRNLLNQADEKLAAANLSLEVTRRQKNEQDSLYREEQTKRQSSEAREKQFVQQMEERMEQDRRYREEQEQQLLALEEERRNFERLLREEQGATDAEKRRREAIEMRTDKSEHQRSTISQDNDRLLHMLKEAEDARATIEQARTETEQKNKKIEDEISQIDEQGAARQKYIDELKAKLEQERARWEGLLRTEQDGRKADNTRYKAREEQLLSEINQFNAGMRAFKEESEDKRRKLETNVMRLEQESKSVEAALKAEESLAEALRERLGVLAEQLSKTEDEVAQSRHDKSASQARVQQFETEKLRTLERERAMDAELQKLRDAEQEKIDAVEQMKRKLHDERMDRERQLHEDKAQARDAIAAKQEAEHILRRAQDEGQRMVDNERRRLEREQRFRKSHEDHVTKLSSALAQGADLSRVLGGLSVPTAEYQRYLDEGHVFPDTAPRLARDPQQRVESPPPQEYSPQVVVVNGGSVPPQQPPQMYPAPVPQASYSNAPVSFYQGTHSQPSYYSGAGGQQIVSYQSVGRLSPQPGGGSFPMHSPSGASSHTAYLLQQAGRPSMSQSYDAAAYEQRQRYAMQQQEKTDVA
eukprot:CAMPEP_0173406500 /NCGR_PEP_ID=MMETSP1356-20130122/64739_1 /TAXON_ID=77927 ORGANISM="Hemiselmis virescens, Strain PCC157" /NCGR_SAMPLE_ID=MMETSP1356 /ASSEMBLY_ACC=CAM_ASM_000847 /LENGTH=817 /DNA_ID=CAMNT_0014367507 /DNA_START=58 /DNA_END=2511 /DNA_ORIENTATION=-